ncbi:MAG: Sir2 family NAD-dependent protein deacetylase [Pseudomonadota bacterium]
MSVQRLTELINSSSKIVFFTGAGISTESGIPDFRSPGGIWSRMQPIEFQDFLAAEEMRRETWRRKIAVDKEISSAKPNLGHHAIAQLVRRGLCDTVITQNIDGLHQASGITEDKIVELHGNGTYATCLECGKRFELRSMFEAYTASGEAPLCDVCNGFIKPATISFGQAMPTEPMQRAQEATLNCDLFLAVGSSLVVYPAAAFPAVAADHGAKLVIINRDPTDLDPLATLVVNEEIGPTLSAAVGIH